MLKKSEKGYEKGVERPIDTAELHDLSAVKKQVGAYK